MPEQFKTPLLSPLFIISWGGGEDLFQAWLGFELAAAFLPLFQHLCGTAAGLMSVSAPE